MTTEQLKPYIEQLELSEYLFSNTHANSTHLRSREDNLLDLRRMLHLHRFNVMNALMLAGVSMPVEVLSDVVHPQPGNQSPDRPVPVVDCPPDASDPEASAPDGLTG